MHSRSKTVTACFCVIFIFLSLFTGCGTKQDISSFEPEKSFTLRMIAKTGATDIEADIICTSYEDISINFTSPESFKDLSMRVEADKYIVDIGGVSDYFTEEQLSESSFLNVLIKSVRTFVFTNHQSFVYDKSADVFTATLNINGVPVNSIFSKDGYLKCLSCQEIDFMCEFEKI